MDGAHATYQMLKKYFGYAQTKAKQGMFGKVPPSEINIAVGYVDGVLQHMNVPWGDMVLPYVGAIMSMGIENTEHGQLFQLNTRCRKVYKEEVEGFYKAVEQYLMEHSIYRGHAVNGDMEYFDTDRVDPSQFVYTEQVWADAATHIFSPMADSEDPRRPGLRPEARRAVGGAVRYWQVGTRTHRGEGRDRQRVDGVDLPPGIDDPFAIMQTARLYLPIEGTDTGGCLVFMEDIDVLSADKRDPQYTSKLLDAFDGFETKGRPFVLVMTTNHADEITQGMTRPGRIHAIISIGAMDRPGVERLCQRVLGDNLAPDVDFDAVYEATEGYMPAFVREAIERSQRYTIARTHQVGLIATEDLVHACQSLRGQFDLHMAANDRPDRLPALDQMFRQIVTEGANVDPTLIHRYIRSAVNDTVNGAYLRNEDTGDYDYQIEVNG